jgi:hypothetical protein
MAGAQNLAAGQNSVDLEYEREWVAREKKEDDEGNLFYHLPMLRRHHGRWSSLETEAAVHCSEQASNPGWWRWVGAMQLGLTHSAGVAGAQGRAGQMRAPQWHAGPALDLGATEKPCGDSSAWPSSNAASLRVGDGVLREVERARWRPSARTREREQG